MKKSAFPMLAAVLAFLLLISACGAQKNGTQMPIYRTLSPYYQTKGDLLVVEEIPLSPGVDIINSTISAFNSVPKDQELRSPLPDGARILGYALRDGVLRLETDGCEDLEGAGLTVLCCCAVLTFCYIGGIDAVSIYSGETEICPPLTPDDIIIADTSANTA
ncbi:MAG: hypothetical protein EOM54_11955 [Clostridia bacterium]|nr:hypothetical protein [Clostridia bacterium]